eukprot:c27578_g1_i1.p1 GENE.c27578_g1_i1~~c27578_g1_i1.p1  ORF type:complete len:157 (+),score=50.39 c27578_g1_i1:54-524(+)
MSNNEERVQSIADDLRKQGFEVEIVQEKVSVLGQFVSKFRKTSEVFLSTSQVKVTSLESSASTIGSEVQSQVVDQTSKARQYAQRYPQAVLGGTAVAVILPTLWARTLFSATRNFVVGGALGGVVVGQLLYPADFQAQTQSWISKAKEFIISSLSR